MLRSLHRFGEMIEIMPPPRFCVPSGPKRSTAKPPRLERKLAFRARSRYKIPTMKKFLLCSTLAAFACVAAVQAGEDCDKSKAACTDKAKSACAAKSACCTTTKTVVKKADVSVKGATLLVRK